ncbi:MAG: hypothetical protein HYV26_09715 [Candidatus Hydrogenedentes bacterium]|nr:hypothetical protein [Candidatus Hydrogenedentota bacterium]
MEPWTSFFDISPTLDENLRVRTTFSIWMTRWPIPNDVKTEYSNLLFRQIFDYMRKQQLPTGSLNFTDPEIAVAINSHQRATGRGGRVGWFVVNYNLPGREFTINIDDEVIQITIHVKNLRNLVETIHLLVEGLTGLFLQEDLDKLLLAQKRSHNVEFLFYHELELGQHKIENRQVHNFEILRDALALTQRPVTIDQAKSVQNAIPSLGIEQFIRIDYKHHGIVELAGHKYNSFVALEAPWNVYQRRLDLSASIRMEEEFGLQFPLAVDWRIATIDFYRDVILRRFLVNLLAYTTCTYKG